MAATNLGYTYLVEEYSLDARPFQLRAVIDTRTRGRELRQLGQGEIPAKSQRGVLATDQQEILALDKK